MKRLLMTSLSLAIAAVVTLSADNWPQWRGPPLNGVSTEKGLPMKWTPDENIAWKLPMPSRSGATPIIWNDTIFLNVAEPTAQAISSCGRWTATPATSCGRAPRRRQQHPAQAEHVVAVAGDRRHDGVGA